MLAWLDLETANIWLWSSCFIFLSEQRVLFFSFCKLESVLSLWGFGETIGVLDDLIDLRMRLGLVFSSTSGVCNYVFCNQLAGLILLDQRFFLPSFLAFVGLFLSDLMLCVSIFDRRTALFQHSPLQLLFCVLFQVPTQHPFNPNK